jgi:putative mRNA 3-end processing factor
VQDLICLSAKGLYCPPGDFYIDPWQPVAKAFITHAHSDHARVGSQHYWSTHQTVPFLKHRLGDAASVEGVPYNQKMRIGETQVSFHPAGHILGSAQVRVEYQDQVWVFSGDYKRGADPSCEKFEVVPCDTFISEATFALPVYNWESGTQTARRILDWWQNDRERPSLLFCYAVGKAQRILAELAQLTNEKIYLHGAMAALTDIYRAQGIDLLPTALVSEQEKSYSFKGDLVLAPPSAHRSAWMKRFKDPQTAFASGWMQVRGARRRRGYEKGFVLSDHADWNELNQTISETGAKTIFLTHGRTDALARFLTEKGLTVRLYQTQYEEEEGA